MSDRQWDFNTCIGYSFIAFAGLTDGELSEDEYPAVWRAVRSWNKTENMTDEQVGETCAVAHKYLAEDCKGGGWNEVKKHIGGIALWLNKGLEEGGKKAFLDDLVAIAMADGNFHENEKSWLNMYAKTFEVEYKV